MAKDNSMIALDCASRSTCQNAIGSHFLYQRSVYDIVHRISTDVVSRENRTRSACTSSDTLPFVHDIQDSSSMVPPHAINQNREFCDCCSHRSSIEAHIIGPVFLLKPDTARSFLSTGIPMHFDSERRILIHYHHLFAFKVTLI
eukprot:c18236_g1_i1 orf=725-1156(-)